MKAAVHICEMFVYVLMCSFTVFSSQIVLLGALALPLPNFDFLFHVSSWRYWLAQKSHWQFIADPDPLVKFGQKRNFF